MLHERGLAYQAESLVNYDPVDRTVLANEQVLPPSTRDSPQSADLKRLMLMGALGDLGQRSRKST